MLTLPKIYPCCICWKKSSLFFKIKAKTICCNCSKKSAICSYAESCQSTTWKSDCTPYKWTSIYNCLQKCAILLHFPNINWISVPKDLLGINDWTFLSPSMRCNKSCLARDRRDRPLSNGDDLTWWRNESWNFLCWSSPWFASILEASAKPNFHTEFPNGRVVTSHYFFVVLLIVAA